MKNSIIIFYLFCFTQLFFAQNFPYIREWGTFVGGNGTRLMDSKGKNGLLVDEQKNIFVQGNTFKTNNYTSSYYNQFVMGGGNNFNSNYQYFNYLASFSNGGQMQLGSYTVELGLTYNRLMAIDHQNNRYYIEQYTGQIANLASPGVWLSGNIFTSSSYTTVLKKYAQDNTLLWVSYLPNPGTESSFSIKIDQNDNVLVAGATTESIPGLTTPNVFQEQYIDYSNGTLPSPNGYLVKLNSAGQKTWGTYLAKGIYDFVFFEDGIYLCTSYTADMNHTLVPLGIGTFQNVPAFQVLMKLDTNTTQQVWSTYYGVPNYFSYYGGVYDIAVNENGFFVAGYVDEYNNTIGGYYATSGSFQTTIKGIGDMFLTKFDLSGNRVWSTYFGSNDYDTVLGSRCLAVYGRHIVITGNQYGNDNISTENAFLTTPNNTQPSTTNMFFAGFNHNGEREFCSYFGGLSSAGPNEINPYIGKDGTLYLWGAANATTGIGTNNGYFPTMVSPSGNEPFGFISKFVLKEALSTIEQNWNNDLVLYNNPNKGNFYLSGSLLQKQNSRLKIYDASGRLVHQQPLSKNAKQYITLEHFLTKGNYMVEVLSDTKTSLKTFKMIVH